MIAGANISSKEVRRRTAASVVCFVVGVLLLVIKFYAYNLTGSQAIYSDAMESIVNVVTAIAGLVVVYYGSKPADTDHPYGHGKVEYFSATFEGGLVTFAGILVIVEAVKVYSKGVHPLQQLDMGLYLVVGAGIANMLLGIGLKKAGEKYASPSLIASGTHVFSDFLTSVGTIVGLGLILLTGQLWLDTVVAILLGVYMIITGAKLVKGSVSGLMDAEDLELLRNLALHMQKFIGEGIIQIHHARIIRAGWFHHIDAHVVVPEFWSIDEAHHRLDKFENDLIKSYEFGGEANFHLDPCRKSYCRYCDYPKCPIRVEEFVERRPVLLEELRSTTEPNLDS